MSITGILAVGNGEPCPFCVKEGRKDPVINSAELDIFKHMIEEHKQDTVNQLAGNIS